MSSQRCKLLTSSENKAMLTLSVLRANQRQVVVLADLLVEPQRLSQHSLLFQLVLDLFGALQQLVGLLVRQEGDRRNYKTPDMAQERK